MKPAAGLAFALCLLAFAAAAGPRDEYGYAWTLKLEEGRAAHRLTLTAPVYARISDPALRDLEAFNGSGEAIPFGPVPPPAGAAEPPPAGLRVPLPWFALPAAGNEGETRVDVHVERDAKGRLRRLDTRIEMDAPAVVAARDVLIDASDAKGSIEAVELSWASMPTPDVSARFEVLGSSDFEHWFTLVPQASLVDLAQGGFRLTRRSIALPGHNARYLKLRRLDAGADLPVDGVIAMIWSARSGDASPTGREWSEARYVRTARQPQSYGYRIAGPLPVESIAVRLASPNSVSQLTVQSRDADTASWTTHGAFTAFRIEPGTGVLEHDDISIANTRDRQWRVIAEPALDRPPELHVGFRPDQFVILERGPAPYTLAAGSAVARRQDYPMAALLGAVGAELGHEWELPLAGVAAPVSLRGDAALVPPPTPWPAKAWALWMVLGIGVVAVMWMVLRLLRAPRVPD